MSKNQRSIAIVIYSFYPANKRHAEKVLVELARPFDTAHVVNVYSTRLTELLEPHKGMKISHIPFDGQGWEFAAYQLGLNHLKNLGWRGSVLILNDTAGVHYPMTPHMLRGLQCAAALPEEAPPRVTGCLEHAAHSGFSYRNIPVVAWIRSNAFVLTASALKILDWKLYDEQDFKASRVSNSALFLPSFLSDDLAEHIRIWLTASGKKGWKHHVKRASVPPEILAGKAGSILLEKRMSTLVVAAGGELKHCALAPHRLMEATLIKLFFWRRRAKALLA